jgi:hypothetical protein
MEKNGTVYCDRCSLEIKRYDKRIALPRQTTDRQTQTHAHFHDRSSADCWRKTVAEAEARKKAKPTPADMSEYTKWLAQREAKSASANRGGGLLNLPA